MASDRSEEEEAELQWTHKTPLGRSKLQLKKSSAEADQPPSGCCPLSYPSIRRPLRQPSVEAELWDQAAEISGAMCGDASAVARRPQVVWLENDKLPRPPVSLPLFLFFFFGSLRRSSFYFFTFFFRRAFSKWQLAVRRDNFQGQFSNSLQWKQSHPELLTLEG